MNLRSEVSREINGTSNLGQLWEVNGTESRVVGNLESTTNRLEQRHGDVGEVWVSNESQSTLSVSSVTDGCQVWCTETGEVVLVETEGTVDNGQRWNADSWDVTEGHVGGPDEVREADIQALSVRINVEKGGNIADLSAKGLETVVVVDVQSINSVQVNTIESVQEGVGDGNTACGADRLGEGETGESWKSGPVDDSNGLESVELESGQESQVAQFESTSDSGNRSTCKRCNSSIVLDDQITLDLLGSINCDGSRCGGTDQNVTADGCAVSQSGGISSGVDGGSWLSAEGVGGGGSG